MRQSEIDFMRIALTGEDFSDELIDGLHKALIELGQLQENPQATLVEARGTESLEMIIGKLVDAVSSLEHVLLRLVGAVGRMG